MGVQKKYKRHRHASEPSPTTLDSAFLCDPDTSIVSDDDCENSPLNTGFYEEKASQCDTTYQDQATQCTVEHCKFETFSHVPTRIETLKNDLIHVPKPFVVNVHTDDLEIISVNSGTESILLGSYGLNLCKNCILAT